MIHIGKPEKAVSVLILVALLSLVILSRTGSVRKSFAIESYYVGVFWDAECTNPVASVDWGELAPGSTSNVEIFVRNEQLESDAYIFLWTQSWVPREASSHMSLGWNYDGSQLAPDESVPITLTLEVTEDISGIQDFSFDITLFAATYVIGDVNGDKAVDVFDLVIIGIAWGSTPSDSAWNPHADLDQNGIIDIFDVAIVARNWGVAYR